MTPENMPKPRGQSQAASRPRSILLGRSARMKTKTRIATPSQEVGMTFLDALAKLGRVLDAIEQCDLRNQFSVPVCLRAENAVMARMRFILDELDSRLSKMGARNTELIAEWERMP